MSQIQAEYLARRNVITQNIKLWSGILESTKLTKETDMGASILHLSNMVEKAETDLCAKMSTFKKLVIEVTKFLSDTRPQNSEVNFNTVMDSIANIILCLYVFGDIYVINKKKKMII